MSGPYESEREARASVQHILASPPGTGAWGAGNLRLLEDACRAAGVQLGAYDYRILVWLTGWEPETCAVIADLITRAATGPLSTAQRSTVIAALDDAAVFRTERAAAYCLECAESPTDLCEAHADDLDQADAYRHVARELGGAG